MYYFCKLFLPLDNILASIWQTTKEKVENTIKNIHFSILNSLENGCKKFEKKWCHKCWTDIKRSATNAKY